MFADLHCHAHMRSYLCLLKKRKKMEKKGKFSPWTVIATNMYRLKNVDRAAGYGQADLVALWNGNSRLVFNSLYPIEKGFFMTPKEASKGRLKLLRSIVRVATHHKAPLRTLMQHLTMRIPPAMIKFITSNKYDYWDFLQDEYAYISRKSGVKTENKIYTLGIARKMRENNKKRRVKHANYYHAEGTYQIPKNRAEAIEIAKKKEEVIMMALSIEGAHVFGAETEEDEVVLARVDFIKKEWEHPLFFITFSHHFDNGLCGHAHSLPNIASFVLNQEPFMNEGFTDIGWKVIRKLLAIDDNNNRVAEEGYRVLIDLKHMSAKGRKEYYEQIVNPCFEKGDIIPIIASHCSYAASTTLQDLIDDQDKEKDTYRKQTEDGTFYAWNINLCDEDVQMIYKTGGLFGLNFDKRMSGVSPKKKEEKKENLNSIQGLWNNYKAVLRVIYEDKKLSAAQKRKAWDMLAIGTDFDGYIDPISDYKTTIELTNFKQDLLEMIKAEAAKPKPIACVADFDETFTPELVVDKICYNNALEFTLKHYPE